MPDLTAVGPIKPDANGNFPASEDGGVFVPPPSLYDGIPTAGQSTCPICGRMWTVTPFADCMMPACGCYGDDASEANPNRPCESCGMRHAWNCPRRKALSCSSEETPK